MHLSSFSLEYTLLFILSIVDCEEIFFYTNICSYNINNSGFILSTYTMFRVLTSSNIYVLLLRAKISVRMAFTIFIIQWVACDRIPVPFVLWNVKGTKCTQYSEKIFPVFLSTGCPTTYQNRHFFNNSKTNEDIATRFEQEYVRCVRNEEECVCSECLFRCNIFIGFRIIKEMPGLVGSGTPYIW